MFWEFYQTRQIGNASRKAERASADADRVVTNMLMLENKVESLALACQSLWELLRENTKLTEQDLEAKMEQVDLRDGRQDGKMSSVSSACPDCGRKTSRRRPRCLYCGANAGSPEVFGRKK
jgi:hypothetical protein